MTTFRVPRSCSGPGAWPGVSTRPVRAVTGWPCIEPGSSHTVSRNRLQPGLGREGARPEALVRTDSATQGNAFNSASQTVGASFLGPVIGGVIVAAGGTSTAFALDAGTFVVSALCLLMMAHVPAPALSGRSVVADAPPGHPLDDAPALALVRDPRRRSGASSVDWLFSICLSPLGLVFAGALASSIGVRETVLVGSGVSALSCCVIFLPGLRDPERADYAPVPLPGQVIGGQAGPLRRARRAPSLVTVACQPDNPSRRGPLSDESAGSFSRPLGRWSSVTVSRASFQGRRRASGVAAAFVPYPPAGTIGTAVGGPQYGAVP